MVRLIYVFPFKMSYKFVSKSISRVPGNLIFGFFPYIPIKESGWVDFPQFLVLKFLKFINVILFTRILLFPHDPFWLIST